MMGADQAPFGVLGLGSIPVPVSQPTDKGEIFILYYQCTILTV
jgi:hypothetical protein